VTVHVVATPGLRLAGAHASDDTARLGATVTVAVVLPPSVAVSVTVWDAATVPALAVNVVDVVLAGTLIEAGTGNAVVLFDEIPTVLPPVRAGWSSVTVQVVDVPEVTLVGAHARDVTAGLGVTVTAAVVLPPSVAVSVTV
jgi:hypothetical protein